jgi:photosystem II stability/assembly factor-like uncharacterized protein
MRSPTLLAAVLLSVSAAAQTAPAAKPSPWILQTSNSTASLRGIHVVDDGGAGAGKIAWASGSAGTVLKTEDGGTTWQKCPVPGSTAGPSQRTAGPSQRPAGPSQGAEKLDFRGIWAWDAQTAIVMSSGPGDTSRIYKTTDGCKTWKLEYTNPEPVGFWDTIVFADGEQGFVLGDPVGGSFRIFETHDQGETWFPTKDTGLKADATTAGAFAASNSAITTRDGWSWFGSGGKGGAYVTRSYPKCAKGVSAGGMCPTAWQRVAVPMAGGTAGAGVFSVDSRPSNGGSRNVNNIVAVGGDYEKPAETYGTATYSLDSGLTWAAAAVPPHGYRSAVTWDKNTRVWITVGTNGSDFSLDDGKTWQPLDNGDWNALSLPFAVGPRGRIARLAPGAIPAK